MISWSAQLGTPISAGQVTSHQVDKIQVNILSREREVPFGWEQKKQQDIREGCCKQAMGDGDGEEEDLTGAKDEEEAIRGGRQSVCLVRE